MDEMHASVDEMYQSVDIRSYVTLRQACLAAARLYMTYEKLTFIGESHLTGDTYFPKELNYIIFYLDNNSGSLEVLEMKC